MTWVIGASTIFGYGIVISDIRVTCQTSGKTMDVLQKAFPMGKWMVGGLAGDVSIGLTLLRSLQLLFDEMNPAPDECCEPEWVAAKWPKEAMRIYAAVARDNDIGECHILTVGLQPTSTDTLGGATVCVSVYRSPDFLPETVVAGNQVQSIGSGADVSRYRELLEHMISDKDLVYMRGEQGSIGGFGRVIWNMLRREVTLHPVEGVSPHFQLFLIRLGGIDEWHSPQMPDVAHNWPELLEKINNEMDSDALIATEGEAVRGQRLALSPRRSSSALEPGTTVSSRTPYAAASASSFSESVRIRLCWKTKPVTAATVTINGRSS